MHNCGGDFCLYCKTPHKIGDNKICTECKKEDNIQNKMRRDKCEAYTAKGTLGYQEGNHMFQLRKGQQRERKTKKTKKGEAKPKLKTKVPQRGGERNPWKSTTEEMKKDMSTQR